MMKTRIFLAGAIALAFAAGTVALPSLADAGQTLRGGGGHGGGGYHGGGHGGGYRVGGAYRRALFEPLIFSEAAARQVADTDRHRGEGDPHLRSVASVNGYHVHATDGDLGYIENFLVDDVNWDIRYLVIATRNWWPGKHVQLAPYAVKGIDWSERRINVNVTRDHEIKPGLGPPGHGGPSRRATITPPFRLARLRLVARTGDGGSGV